MPTIRALVRSSAFLRRSDTQPEEKFVHRTESAIIGAALWWPLHRISASCCPANCIAHRSSRETTGAPLATTALRGFLCFPARGRPERSWPTPAPACPGGTPAHQIRCARNISARFTRTRHSDIVHPVSSSQLMEARDRVRSFGGYNKSSKSVLTAKQVKEIHLATDKLKNLAQRYSVGITGNAPSSRRRGA